MAAGGAVSLTAIANPNGAETFNGLPFYWIGPADTALSATATKSGEMVLTARFIAGPSVPGVADRRLEVRVGDVSRTAALTHNEVQTVVIPVQAGQNTVRLRGLDTPTVTLPTDSRTLLLGMSNPVATMAPHVEASCRAELTAGWVGAETVRGGWFRQVTPSGAEIVLVSDVSASLTVDGQVERGPAPQIVSVASGGQTLETWTVPAGERALGVSVVVGRDDGGAPVGSDRCGPDARSRRRGPPPDDGQHRRSLTLGTNCAVRRAEMR